MLQSLEIFRLLQLADSTLCSYIMTNIFEVVTVCLVFRALFGGSCSGLPFGWVLMYPTKASPMFISIYHHWLGSLNHCRILGSIWPLPRSSSLSFLNLIIFRVYAIYIKLYNRQLQVLGAKIRYHISSNRHPSIFQPFRKGEVYWREGD